MRGRVQGPRNRLNTSWNLYLGTTALKIRFHHRFCFYHKEHSKSHSLSEIHEKIRHSRITVKVLLLEHQLYRHRL